MLTMERFVASGVDTQDIGVSIQDDSYKGDVGRIYLGCLFIVKGKAEGEWWTVIENTQPSGTLHRMESVLFDWALKAGYAND